MKQKLLLILCFVMLVLEVKAEYSKIIDYAYYSTTSTYFLNNYDILRNARDTPDQIAHGEITYMGITKVTIDNNNISIDPITSNTYRLYRKASALEIYCHNTSKSNCIAPIESATASTNSSNDYQYGFNITYYRNKPQTFDIYGEIVFKYYDSFYTRSFHLRITPGTQYTNGIRFTSSTTSTTPQTNPITVFTKEVLTLYTYSQYSSSLNSSYTGETDGISRVSDNYNSISKYHTATYECIKPGTYTMLVSQDGVACAAVSQQEISGLENAKGVRVGTYSDAGVTIRTVNTSYVRGLIADDVPSGQEDRYGVTITYPRNKRKKYVLQMYVSYTYTTNSTYANNEEEDYKMFYVVLDPDFPRMKEGKIKPGEMIDINSLGTYFTGATCNLTGENASDASISGTNFTSNVEGVYNIDVYKGTNKIDATRIHVSKHNYPYYEFNYEADYARVSSNQQFVDFQHDIFVSYLPAWDFESQVGGKNVRFCINDDEETVTLVAATPILIKRHTETGLPIAEFDEDHSKYNTFSKNALYTGFPWKEFDANSYNQHLWDGDGNVIFDVNYISAYGINTDVLEIPQTVVYDGKSYTVTKIGDGALPYTKRSNSTGTLFVVKANSIKLPTSIKEIGYSAFYQTNASAVNFEELVNLESIGAQAFYQSKIANVDLTKCTELQNIGVNTSDYDLGSVFYGCTQLKKVDISGLQNLRFLSPSTFRECTELEELDMHDCVQIDRIPSYFCYGCTSLHFPNMENCPIEYIGNSSFFDCNFAGQTFDCRRLKAPYPNGKWKDFTVGFERTGLKNMILPPFEGNNTNYILLLVKDSNTKPAFENIFIFEFGKYQPIIFQYEGSNKDINIFMSQYNNIREPQNAILENNSTKDAHGPRVFPMISSNTSGVRTMSYFRPLDYKNIKVFDNTHFYDADKSDGTHYNLEDFFRTPENIAKNNIEMLTPYIATDYNVEHKEVTMTALPETTPGIQTKGGIYYKGTGTSTDTEGNEIFYVLTEPEYSVGGYSKSYTNMYTETNYLKGGGKESVVLDKAPHMTETSTQFISKGGTFYYSTPGTLAPYKAYLDLPEFIKTAADTDYSSSAKVTSLSFVWEDEPMQEPETITSVNAISENRNGDIYNLQGMKVKTPQRSGLYISNGRKVLVK